MILAWGQTTSPDKKYQALVWIHMKDWVTPPESIAMPILNSAFETILKLTQDSGATRIGIPGQKQNSNLTFFNTVLKASQARILERYRNSVSVYLLGLSQNSEGNFQVYSNLPTWINIVEVDVDLNINKWNSTPNSQTDTLSDSNIVVNNKSELVFFIGKIPNSSFQPGFQISSDKIQSVRLIDYFGPHAVNPNAALTQWSPKSEKFL